MSNYSYGAPVENGASVLKQTCDQILSRHPEHAAEIRGLYREIEARSGTPEEFGRRCLSEILRTSPIAPAQFQQRGGGFSSRELKGYSLFRALRAQIENRPIDGLEREASDEIAHRLEKAPGGFYVPDEAFLAAKRHLRALSVGSPADGGYTVGQELLGAEFVTLLQNSAHCVALGARFLGGLVGNVTIPRQLTGATSYWVSETGTVTQSNATFGQIVGRPRRIGCSVPFSKQFLAQTSLDAESFILNDINASQGVELDRTCIRGSGGAEPLGILNLASADRSTSITFSGAATLAKLLEAEANLATSNAITGSPAWLTTPASRAKWKAIQRFTNGDTPLWANDNDVAGYRGRATNQFASTPTANLAILGDFAQVLIMQWAGTDVVVDPFTSARTGQVEITVSRLVDIVIRQGKGFVISTDSGAQ